MVGEPKNDSGLSLLHAHMRDLEQAFRRVVQTVETSSSPSAFSQERMRDMERDFERFAQSIGFLPTEREL